MILRFAPTSNLLSLRLTTSYFLDLTNDVTEMPLFKKQKANKQNYPARHN